MPSSADIRCIAQIETSRQFEMNETRHANSLFARGGRESIQSTLSLKIASKLAFPRQNCTVTASGQAQKVNLCPPPPAHFAQPGVYRCVIMAELLSSAVALSKKSPTRQTYGEGCRVPNVRNAPLDSLSLRGHTAGNNAHTHTQGALYILIAFLSWLVFVQCVRWGREGGGGKEEEEGGGRGEKVTTTDWKLKKKIWPTVSNTTSPCLSPTRVERERERALIDCLLGIELCLLSVPYFLRTFCFSATVNLYERKVSL